MSLETLQYTLSFTPEHKKGFDFTKFKHCLLRHTDFMVTDFKEVNEASLLFLGSSQVFATRKRQGSEGDSTLEKKSEYVRRDLLCNNIQLNRL